MPSSQPLVSIALTSYNGEKFIHEQIKSLLKQSYPSLEIVICDDCSTDRTVELVEEHKNRKIQLYRNEKNLGYIKNFEKACSLCTGEYIALCDQDDIWELDKIERLLDVLVTRPSATGVFTNAKLIDAGSNELPSSLWESIRFTPSETSIEKPIESELFYSKNVVTGCTMLFRRDLVQAAIPFPTSIPHDHWLAFVAASNGELIACNEKLIQYRLHANNAIGVSGIKRKSRLTKNIASLFSVRAKLQKEKRKFSERFENLDRMRNYELTNNSRCSETLDVLFEHAKKKLLSKKLKERINVVDNPKLSSTSSIQQEKISDETLMAAKLRIIGRSFAVYSVTAFCLYVVAHQLFITFK